MKKIAVFSGCVLCLVLLLSVCHIVFKELNAGEEARSKDMLAEADSNQSIIYPELQSGWKLHPMTEEALAQGTLVLVNRDHAYEPSNAQTVNVYEYKTGSYYVRDTILSVHKDAMNAINRWMDDFYANTGKQDINIVAGWRSYDDQTRLYRNAVSTKEQAHADAYLALPGYSEHHTGLAIDLNTYDMENGTSADFDGIGDYAWALEHAWEYGFVQRYPPQKNAITGIEYESWHFRYVGLPHAYVMKTENLCLEEYIDYLRNFSYSGDHLYVTCSGIDYELYYCDKDQVMVPITANYMISGNNVDGFIVTIEQTKLDQQETP